MAQIEFSEVDFKNCKYNVYGEVNAFAKYPLLKVIYSEVMALFPDKIQVMVDDVPGERDNPALEWTKYFTKEQLMKYVVFCYHKSSPLISSIEEIKKRKIQALTLAGVDVNKVQENPDAKLILANILLSRHEFTTRLTLHFLKHENNLLWSEYVQLQDILEEATYEMNNAESGDLSALAMQEKKSKLYSIIQKYRSDLKTIAEHLMQQDTELQSFMSSHVIEFERTRLITPEDFVKLNDEELIRLFRRHSLVA